MTLEEFQARWSDQHEDYKRVTWARMYWQLKTYGNFGRPSDAARALGMRPNTYALYERGPAASKFARLSHQYAIKFGRKFNVDWTWLLTGEGTPFDSQLPLPQERVIRAMSEASEIEQNAIAEMIEAFFKTRIAG